MEGASTRAIEASIALAPFSFRVQLFSLIPPLIAAKPSEADALEGRPTQIQLTQAGRDAIRECAEWMKRSTESGPESVYGEVHSFSVAKPIEEVWSTVVNLNKVVPLVPNAVVVDGTSKKVTARIKFKVGSRSLQYTALAEVIEQNDAAHRAVFAAADNCIVVTLSDGRGKTNGTLKSVVTPPAKDGISKDALDGVTESLIQGFTDNLAKM
jgi:carbon monoxide dehydrogenase subunit G